jgi:hypothetical protein
MHNRHFALLILLAIPFLLIFSHQPAVSQTLPGHWVSSLSISHPNALANSMNFIDSSYGFVFIDSGTLLTHFYRTIDGGKNWSLFGSTDSGYHMFSGVTHSLQLLTKRDIYYAGASADFWSSSDSGRTFQLDLCPWSPTNFIAGTMFTPGFGKVIVGNPQPSFQVYETYDSGLSFTTLSGTSSITGQCNDALFLDSSNWLVALNYKNILRTRDGGLTWDTVLNPNQVSFYKEALTSTNRSRVYVTGGLFNGKGYSASYFESTDTGNTWRADSTIYGNRIARMASPSPGKLWALVRTSLQSPADSLFYSSDDGLNWAKDSVTFIGKSLLDIVWPDSNHGYIFAQNGDTVLVYRYVTDQSGVSETTFKMDQLSIFCYPNPTSSILNIVSSTGLLSIFDPLGRSYEVKQTGNTLDVSSLPSGVYFVSDGHSRAKFVKE